MYFYEFIKFTVTGKDQFAKRYIFIFLKYCVNFLAMEEIYGIVK